MLSLILLFSRCSLMFNRKTNRASMLHHYRVTKDRPGLYFFFSSFSGVYISGKHILVLLQTWSFFVKRNISFPFVFLLCIWGGLRQEPAQQQKCVMILKKKFLNSPGVFLHVSLLLVFLFQFWRTTITHASSKSFYKTWAPPCTVWPSMAGVSSWETSTSGCAVWKPLLNGSRSWTTSRSPRYFYWNRRVGGPQNFQTAI